MDRSWGNGQPTAPQAEDGGHGTRDWERSMSDNVATALLVYTALLIFFTVKALAGVMGASLVPYMMLVVLVGVIIPICRFFEKRWVDLPENAADDPALQGAFRRDQLLLWSFAIGFPLLLAFLFKALAGGG